MSYPYQQPDLVHVMQQHFVSLHNAMQTVLAQQATHHNLILALSSDVAQVSHGVAQVSHDVAQVSAAQAVHENTMRALDENIGILDYSVKNAFASIQNQNSKFQELDTRVQAAEYAVSHPEDTSGDHATVRRLEQLAGRTQKSISDIEQHIIAGFESVRAMQHTQSEILNRLSKLEDSKLWAGVRGAAEVKGAAGGGLGAQGPGAGRGARPARGRTSGRV